MGPPDVNDAALDEPQVLQDSVRVGEIQFIYRAPSEFEDDALGAADDADARARAATEHLAMEAVAAEREKRG